MAEKMKLEENQIFMDKLMEWREKASDWLAATTNEEIDAIFNVPRTIEPDVRHPEDFDWGDG